MNTSKRIIASLFLQIFLFFTLITADCYSFQNEPDGFRGIKWGTEFSTLKNMVYKGTDESYGGIKLYNKRNDEMNIGSAKLTEVLYGFWQGKFEGVRIETKGYVNFSNLKETCFQKFPGGWCSHSGSCIWDGAVTFLSLEYNEITEKGELWINSISMRKQMKKYDEQKAKEGAATGF
jgi:hypothetical protein